MLTWDPDMNRVLDLTIKQSIPFLLLAPQDFREDLRVRLVGLHQYCRQNRSDMFDDELRTVNKMITDYDFGESVNVYINYMKTKMQPFNETLAKHSEILADLSTRMDKLEKKVKVPRKNKETPANSEPQLIEIENAPLPFKKQLTPTNSVEPWTDPVADFTVLAAEPTGQVAQSDIPITDSKEKLNFGYSEKALKGFRRSRHWSIITLLCSQNRPITPTEINERLDITNKKVLYDAIYQIGKHFPDNLIKTRNDNNKVSYQWVETPESKAFFSELDKSDGSPISSV